MGYRDEWADLERRRGITATVIATALLAVGLGTLAFAEEVSMLSEFSKETVQYAGLGTLVVGLGAAAFGGFAFSEESYWRRAR